MNFFGKVFNGVAHVYAFVLQMAQKIGLLAEKAAQEGDTVATEIDQAAQILGPGLKAVIGPNFQAILDAEHSLIGCFVKEAAAAGKPIEEILAAIQSGGFNFAADAVALEAARTLLELFLHGQTPAA